MTHHAAHTETRRISVAGAAAGDADRELLFRLLSAHPTPAPEWDALARRVNWARVVEETGPQLIPYVGHQLEHSPIAAAVPPDITRIFVQRRQRSAIAYVRQRAVLRAALETLDRHGITAVALKGVALSHLVYADPTLRQMLDLDLWVESERVTDAVAALVAVGWRGLSGGPDEGLDADAASRHLCHPTIRVTIELHGPPESLSKLPAARLRTAWNRAQPTAIGDFTVRVLHRDDLLLHLSLNAEKDNFHVGLRPLLDLRLLVERQRDDWAWRDLASDYRASRVVVPMYLSLLLARDLLGAPVPDEFFDSLPRPAHIDEIQSLATRSAVEAVSCRLPGYAEALAVPTSAAARWRQLVRRLTTFYLPRGRDAWRTPIKAVGGMGSRLAFDLFVKGPRDWRFWRNLLFQRAEVKRGVDLAQARARLASLMTASENAAHDG